MAKEIKYTLKQVEEILDLEEIYRDVRTHYEMMRAEGQTTGLESLKEEINEHVDECKEKIPKSLIDRFQIEKLE